jgi:uncharacterized membrane protein YsdA (DUF1294 family)
MNLATHPVLAVVAYVVLINAATFLTFAWDKYCAGNGMWRVPERTLLTMAFAGGTPGAMAGQRWLRHKTRKEPFRSQLLLIAIVQVVALLALSLPPVRAVIAEMWSHHY